MIEPLFHIRDKMKKIIPFLVVMILLVGLVTGFSFIAPNKLDFTYNPYTYKNQYLRSSNFSGENITADYYYGDISKATGIQQGELILYFLNQDSSDVTGNKTISSIENTTEVTLLASSLPSGSTKFADWITDAGVPNLGIINQGNWFVHVEGKKTGGTKDVQFYYELYVTDSIGGNERLISTSAYSDTISDTRSHYDIDSSIQETDINVTDRIKVKGYAYVSGGGSAPSVEAYIQGSSNTRLTLPVGAVSVEKFIPYTGAIKDVNLGDNDFTVDTNTLYVDSSNDRVGISRIPTTKQFEVDGLAGFNMGSRGAEFNQVSAYDAVKFNTISSTDNLIFGISGTTSIFLQQATKYVGIGNNVNPLNNLHIVTEAWDKGISLNRDGYINSRRDITFGISGVDGDALGFSHYGGAGVGYDMVIRASGDVGIGTTNPEANLHIMNTDTGVAPDSGGDNLVIENNGDAGISILGGNSAGDYSTIYFGSPNGNRRGGVVYQNNGDILYLRALDKSRVKIDGTRFIINEEGDDVDTRVESSNDANMLFIDGGTDRVGIGTSSPTQKLHVIGNMNISGWTFEAGEYKCDNGTHTIRSRNKTLLNNMGCSI